MVSAASGIVRVLSSRIVHRDECKSVLGGLMPPVLFALGGTRASNPEQTEGMWAEFEQKQVLCSRLLRQAVGL